MADNFLLHKNNFRLTLEPIIQLLEFKRSGLPLSEWIRFFETTKSSILNHPEQYLGQDLPAKNIIRQAVEEIFYDVFEHENVLNSRYPVLDA